MSELRLYNTLTRTKAPFAPSEGDTVRLYTCGPTVYDVVHVGNLRTFLFYDVMRRYFRYRGLGVKQVMNITDVDDKTINGAQREGVSLRDYTDRYIPAFLEDIRRVNIERPEVMPRATDYIPQMHEITAALLAKGLAYQSAGSIYFRVAAFEGYGRLSRRRPDDVAGATQARVDSDEYKEEVADFALWKAAKPGEPSWDSPWGSGRPGWHIECSAMARTELGDTIDIHSGGVDLIFPHHENEIAQSEGATGKPFARFWVHPGYVIVEGQKMSKSLGNFYTLQDLLDRGYEPPAIRLALTARAHYRSQLDLRMDMIDEAQQSLARLRDFADRVSERLALLGERDASPGREQRQWLAQAIQGARDDFQAAMDDDLNLPGALGHVFDFMRPVNTALAEGWAPADLLQQAADALDGFDSVLGVIAHERQALDDEVEALIRERDDARTARDYARSDAIRAQLLEMGIQLEDTPTGTRWRRAG